MEFQSNSSLVFNVTRQRLEFVRPTYSNTTKPTKLILSDIDDQDFLRFKPFLVQFYRQNPSMKDKDPAMVIRKALGQALVFYYPLAGRLKEEYPNRKLFVDCTDEGIMFMEADIDVTFEQLDNGIPLSFSCLKKLIYDVPPASSGGGILNSPLLLIQVTRLKCRGFIMAIRMNHLICDAFGISQFMFAVAEIARGASSPSLLPIWQRELLCARQSIRVTCEHDDEYNQLADTKIMKPITFENMVQRSFFFGPKEVSIIKQILPPHLRKSTTFDIVTSFLWRYRTIALRLNPKKKVRILCVHNAREKFNPPIPMGYYGNVIVFSMALTTVEMLCNSPLEYAVQLIKKSKLNLTEEYMGFNGEIMVIKGRPNVNDDGTYVVSDCKNLELDHINFGWGKPVYITIDANLVLYGKLNFYIPFVNKEGEKGIVVPISLPASSMDRFSNDLHQLFTYRSDTSISSLRTKSAL